MELINYMRALRRHWISVVAIFVGGILAGGVASILTIPVYSASSSVIFTVPTAATPSELSYGSSFAATQAKTYVELARAPLLLDGVIRRLDLQATASDLAGRITASNPTNTAIVTITATGPDARQTASIANAVADGITDSVDELAPEGPSGTKGIKVTMVSSASVPSEPTSPRLVQNLALGALIGLMLAVGQAALREHSGTRPVRRSNSSESADRPGTHSLPVLATDSERADEPEDYREQIAELRRSVDAILARLG